MIEIITSVIAAAAAVAAAMIARSSNKTVKQQGGKIDAIKWQNENEHQDSEYPNQRDELTATRRAVADLAEAVESKFSAIDGKVGEMGDKVTTVSGSVHGVERKLVRVLDWLGDLSTGSELIEDTISRKDAAQARALQAAVDERTSQLEERDKRFDQHLRALPGLIGHEIDKRLGPSN